MGPHIFGWTSSKDSMTTSEESSNSSSRVARTRVQYFLCSRRHDSSVLSSSPSEYANSADLGEWFDLDLRCLDYGGGVSAPVEDNAMFAHLGQGITIMPKYSNKVCRATFLAG